MSDFFKIRRPLPPPPRPPTINAAEFIALRTIVMGLVATMASQYEESGIGIAQEWINHFSARCQAAILAGDISISDGSNTERMRREAMEHVNHILGGIRFPTERSDHN